MLKELREKQAKLLAEARARLAEITDKTDEARAKELEGQHDAAMAEYDALEERAKRLVALDEADKRMNPADPRRPNEDRSEQVDENDDTPAGREARDRAAGVVYRKAMQWGVEALTDAERRTMSRFRANMTAEMRAQSTSSTAGGYTIPQGFLAELTKTMALWGPMLDESFIRLIRTDTGNTLPWPTVNDTSNTGVDHTQNSADADQDVTFGQNSLGAYMFGSGIVKVSFELLQDSAFDFDQLLHDLFGERLARRANTKLTTGAGGGSAPSGIATGATGGITAASATAITADELIDVFHSVDPAYRGSPKCGWQFNDSTLKAIRKLKDGQGNYLWAMGDVKSGAPATLLDKPYRVNQAMANIATGNKVALFGDMSKYVVRQVKDFTMLRLNERFADAGQVGFMAFNRLDGLLADVAAVKYYKMA